MQAERIVVRHVRLPLRQPFVTALGVERQRDVVIVEAHGGGVVGYGEAPVLAYPAYNEETVQTAWHVLNDVLVPRLLSEPLAGPSDAVRIAASVRGHAMAKAALEGALWDLWAKGEGRPLSECLGGSAHRVPAGAVVGLIPDTRELVRAVERKLAQGYRRVKIKIKPGWDLTPLREIRRAFAGAPLAADANGAYRPSEADVLLRLDELNLDMIEQPFPWDHLVDHARLQARLATPVCLDEGISTPQQVRDALALGSARTFNVKPGRLGGLSAALAVHRLCREAGIAVWCGGLLESGVGRAHNLALASLEGFSLPGDLSPPGEYLLEDIVEPALVLDSDGHVAIPDGPGIGVRVREDVLDGLTVRRRIHRASGRLGTSGP
ncbi:MAG: o-succinylbenzoate synthase [Firmicutes bacterium]|nr:o-succinylbenzoate synthase [Bacillota bacterium]